MKLWRRVQPIDFKKIKKELELSSWRSFETSDAPNIVSFVISSLKSIKETTQGSEQEVGPWFGRTCIILVSLITLLHYCLLLCFADFNCFSITLAILLFDCFLHYFNSFISYCIGVFVHCWVLCCRKELQQYWCNMYLYQLTAWLC